MWLFGSRQAEQKSGYRVILEQIWKSGNENFGKLKKVPGKALLIEWISGTLEC